jgi:hypothetical protein
MAKKLFLERERAIPASEAPSLSREELDSGDSNVLWQKQSGVRNYTKATIFYFGRDF